MFDTWHFEPLVNEHVCIAKALGRTKLMMSSVIVTVPIPETNIRPCRDGLDDDMADGACGVSRSVMAQAWEMYREATNTDDNGVVPSAMQARLNSKKGVWYVDDRIPDGCIEYRNSQEKWYIPCADPEQLRLEVCCFSSDSGPARLNLQLIRLLELRMAQPELLIDLLNEQLHQDEQALTNWEACERFCRDAGDKGEAVMEKLHSHWSLDDEIVQALLRKAMELRHDQCIDENKLHITLPQSRDYLIIPDPFQILDPEEVVVQVPGLGFLEGDVIIARSPCYDPGELLKVKAVHPLKAGLLGRRGVNQSDEPFEWFDSLQSLVVLSTKPVMDAFGPHSNLDWDGLRSVADLMQGGDYDGDTVKVIWNPRFVDGFRHAEPPVYSEPGEVDWARKHPIGSQTPAELKERGLDVHNEAFNYFLDVIRHYGQSVVGRASTLHDEWSLQAAGNWDSDAGNNCRLLGDIFHKAMDSVQAGYVVTLPDHLTAVQRTSFNRRSAPELADGMGDDCPMYSVWISPLERAVKSEMLETALEVTYGLQSVCGSWVPPAAEYGWVYFRSEAEQRHVIGKELTLFNKKATIRHDTRDQKRTSGVMDAIWAAYSRFSRVNLAALDNDLLEIPPDPEIELTASPDPRWTRSAAEQAARQELGRVCALMCRAYQNESCDDGSLHRRMVRHTPHPHWLKPHASLGTG